MKKFFTAALAILLLSASAANAQQSESGRILGRVFIDTAGVAAASVELNAEKIVVAKVLTGEDGRFAFNKVAFGTYGLKVEYIGCKPQLIREVIVSPESPVVDLGLVLMQRAMIARAASYRAL